MAIEGRASLGNIAAGRGVLYGEKRLRREDRALITGNANYTDNIQRNDVLHAAIYRSWHGHADIVDIDTRAAEDHEDVVAVFTANDLEAEDVGMIKINRLGDTVTPFPMIARSRVRYYGEPVAIVIAEDRYVAHDAVDLIDVDFDPLPSVTDQFDATREDAPLVHDEIERNRAFDWDFGDKAAVEQACEAADRVITVDVYNQRLIPNAMEPRSVLAEYDRDAGQLNLHLSTQAPFRIRDRFCRMLKLPEERLRVIAPDVGGGFGSKGGTPYAAEPLTAWSAMRLERPVKWVATRSESHQTDHHGRDIQTSGKVAVDIDGSIRAIHIDARINLGAYLLWEPTRNIRSLLSGAYEIHAMSGRVVGTLTHSAPVAPYRGAGRPEAIYFVERIIDEAAAELGIDPAEIRRRNFIPPDAFPYESPVGYVYDSGDYETALERALELVDYSELRDRQRQLREQGRYLGIGFCSFVENSGTGPSLTETARVELDGSGLTVYCGTADHGQGHGTTFAQMLEAELGVPYDDIEVHEGDTDDLEQGVGTFGSRSAAVGGSAIIESARTIREKARRLVAEQFDARIDDVIFENGTFSVSTAPSQSIEIRDVPSLVSKSNDEPTAEDVLTATSTYDPPHFATAFGTHVAVVFVDPQSGEIDFERYVAVDDCGVQLNPLIVEGQVHGGIAQGIGQAMYEHGVYDENGTLLTASFLDYAMPRSNTVPELELDSTITPCPHNPSGVKGVGEGGTIAAPPAVVNAVIDALRPLGVNQIDMPLNEESVWKAMHEGA